jgi:hypothetical protein
MKIEKIVPQSDGTSHVFLEDGQVKSASLARLKLHPIKVGDEYEKVEYDVVSSTRVKRTLKKENAPETVEKPKEDLVEKKEPEITKTKTSLKRKSK